MIGAVQRESDAATRPGSDGATKRRSDEGAPASCLCVRPALPGDVVPLGFFCDTVLRRDYFLRRGQLESILRGPHHRVLVAELDGVLVGVAILTRGTRLINALVHPAYRGLGVGRALVEASGASEVLAKIDMSAGDPRPFYRRIGFVSTGTFNVKGNIELMCKDALPRGVSRTARGARKPERRCCLE